MFRGRKKACIRVGISLIMAGVMGLFNPMQIYAAETSVYVSDVKVGYGDSGKKALESAGYTVWDMDANKDAAEGAVYVGYKTSTDEKDAIRDLAVMNMDGGYSFGAYTEEVKEMEENVANMVDQFQTSVEEFRANYKAGSPYAEQAIKIMNMYKDDDTDQLIGDMFLNTKTTKEELETVFLEGNTNALDAIESALALGCTDTTPEDTILDRLPSAEYTEDLDTDLNDERQQLSNVWDDFRTQVESAEATYTAFENSGRTEEDYASTLEGQDLNDFVYDMELYDIVSNTEFGADADGMTLKDAALMDDSELTNADINVLAESMTMGQLGVVGVVGIPYMLICAYSCNYEGDGEVQYTSKLESLLNGMEDQDPVSVYFEVDRTLFSDTDTVALTSAAMVEKAKTQGKDFGKDESTIIQLNHNAQTIIMASAAVSGLVALGCLASETAVKLSNGLSQIGTVVSSSGEKITFAGDWEYVVNEVHHCELNGYSVSWGYEGTCWYGTYSSTISTVTTVVGVVALIACIVLTVITILSYMSKTTTRKVDYTQIPRVLVDLRTDSDGNKSYYNYYAAGLITAKDSDTDYMKLYGDLNGAQSKTSWEVLYYSKDARLGNPLTPDMIVKYGSGQSLTTEEAKNCMAVHGFSSTAAANLNQYNTDSNATPVYMYVKYAADTATAGTETADAVTVDTEAADTTDTADNSLVGTVAAKNGYAVPIIAFLLGLIAGGAAIGVYGSVRRKKEKV